MLGKPAVEVGTCLGPERPLSVLAPMDEFLVEQVGHGACGVWPAIGTMMATLGQHLGDGAKVTVQVFGGEAPGLGLDGWVTWVGRHGRSSCGPSLAPVP
ncbi:hypothetical protein CR162_12770 [Pseudoroseomonas rhizosphaerae]|uniref:Uncharacterized protein n=2 Tax=Roseomonas TaxID=125216 RepID=A0A2C6Z7R6_9PROT|nr:hypothetical protein [Roseomonas sp. KE0001]PHK94551.1 hypothetical protein CR162_12770 [Pseudoroseomonas rhizosphaerae]PWC28028.1 hypothetical protein CR165_15555 [Pseudoroseomonas aestuarii]